MRETDQVHPLCVKYGVDQALIVGTGTAGAVTLTDVLTAVRAKRTADARAEAAEVESVRNMHRPARLFGASVGNPVAAAAVSRVRASGQAPTTSPPTLFAAGDVPTFTASGVPAESVLEVPWQARHPLAAATTTADAYAILAACGGADGEAEAVRMFAGHEANLEFEERVERWELTQLSDAMVENSPSAFASDEQTRRAANLPDMSAEDLARIDQLATPLNVKF